MRSSLIMKPIFAATCVGLITSTSARATGTVVVSGDDTCFFSLTDTPPDASDAGTDQFFLNLLGSGHRVAVVSSRFGIAGNEILEFCDGRPGVTASTLSVSDVIKSDGLANVDLLVVPFQSDGFPDSAVQAVSQLVGRGGTVFVTAEAAVIANAWISVINVNGLLEGLNVPMRVDSSTHDIGPQTATGSAITAGQPLTNGVASFAYGATAGVSGGVPLVYAKDGTPFVAMVPEPSILLAALSVGWAVGGRGRRRLSLVVAHASR